MGFADVWNRTLVYFGIAEEEDWDENGYVTEEAERSYSDRPNVRRLTPRQRAAEELDEWSEPESPRPRHRGVTLRPTTRLRGVEAPAPVPERQLRELGITFVYVTHDLSDILALAEDVVVVEQGRVVLQGPPSDVLRDALHRPTWDGKPLENRLEGSVADHDGVKGLTRLDVGGGSLWIQAFHADIGTRVRVSFSAEDVLVSTRPVSGLSARNVFPGRVESLVTDGTDLLGVSGDFPVLVRLTKGAVAELGIRVGSEVHLILKSGSIRCESC